MKKYIKPSTEIHEIELQQMIAGSPVVTLQEGNAQGEGLGKESDFQSDSFWGDDAEEE